MQLFRSRKKDGDVPALPEILTIVDVETTGMRADSARVIDIGIIRIEQGKVVETYQTLLNPGRPISSAIVDIVGITDEDVAGAPSFEDVSDKVLALFEDAVFVAHNAAFDYSFIKAEFARIGVTFDCPTLCTVKLSRTLSPRNRRHNLDAIIERYGFECAVRHRAFPDADVLRQFLEHAQDLHGDTKFKKAVADVMFGNEKPLLFDRTKLGTVPDTAGVYFFYGKDDDLLYIGKSKHLRTRIRSHFSNMSIPSERRLMEQVVRIETRETPGEMSALLLESHLIKHELPIYNRAQRKLKEMAAITASHNADGYLVPTIEKKESLDLSSDIVGVFRSVPQARQKLRDLATEHRLCQKLLGIEKTDRACFGSGLNQCDGACMGKETPEEYNKRFSKAFKKRRIKTWPFKGAIMIDEKQSSNSGAVFFIKDWRLIASFTYDGEDRSEFMSAQSVFDYDSYKIFARFLLDPANRRSCKEVSDSELRTMISGAGHQDDECVYEYC